MSYEGEIAMAMVFAMLGLVCSIVSLVGAIMILVEAFKMSTGEGFLTLCIPCYIFYFVFGKLQSPNKNLMVGLWLGGLIANIICQAIAGALGQPGPGFPR